MDGSTPNIIDIVLDGHARGDVLATRYHQSNAGFLDGLRSRGFRVLDKSTTNYSATAVSLTSMLNMNYVTRPKGFVGDDMEPLTEMMRHNAVARRLSGYGYRSVCFLSGCSFTESVDADEYRSDVESMSRYELSLLGFTPFNILINTWVRGSGNDPYETHRRRVISSLNGIATVDDRRQPVFVFSHVVCPHPPFIFRASGVPTIPDRQFSMWDADDFISQGGSKAGYIQGYREQVAYLDRLVLKSVDSIRGMMHRPSIIIIRSDHGPGLGMNFNDIKSSDLGERMPNLMAIHFPDGDYSGIYPTITGVNIYRVVLSKYLGARYPLLPDRNYFVNWRHPYRQTLLSREQIERSCRQAK